MKKTQQAIISIVSFIILLTFTEIAFSEYTCTIQWWGDKSGSVPTNETSLTEAAASQAFTAILGFDPVECEFQGIVELCIDKPFSEFDSYNPDCSYVGYNQNYYPNNTLPYWSEIGPPTLYGEWDVVCTDLCEASGGDSDIDGICDDVDNCPNDPDPAQADCDGDGIGDVCSSDSDTDGLPDACDSCPNDALNDADGDGVCGDVDNCPNNVNPDQADGDSDGIGDFCENCNIIWWTDASSCETCEWGGPIPIPDCNNTWCDIYDPSGSTVTMETSRTQQAAAEVYSNILNGSPEWTGSCYSYNYMDEFMYRTSNNICLDGTWYFYDEWGWWSSYGENQESNGSWDVICGEEEDIDGDGVLDGTDNCPDISNPNQEDADNDTIGDVCDPDTIYGTIHGDVQGGVSINIETYSCGTGTLVATIKTNEEGYYAVGGLGTDSYGILPQYSNYVFSPKTQILRVPQTNIRSYAFTATVAP